MKSLRLLGIGLALSGCATGISISHVTSSQTALTGVPWNLAMTQYSVTITRQIIDCKGGVKGSVTVSTTVRKALDDQQRYLLDASGIWATSDITSTLAADGTSTGLNAQSQDETATVVANIVSLAAQAAVARGQGIPSAKQPTASCTTDVANALAALNPPNKPALKDLVDTDTTALMAATARVTVLTAQVANDKSYKTALAAALGALAKAQARLSADQAQLTKYLKKVSDTETVTWPQQADQFTTPVPFQLPQAVLDKWVTFELPVGTVVKTPPHLSEFDVYLTLYSAAPDGSWHMPTTPPATGDVSVGVPVRLPRIGRLLACSGEPCLDPLPPTWVPSDTQSLALIPDQPVLQLGQMYNVRVAGGVFKSENAVITLDSNGVPTSIEVAEKAAAAAAATGSAASAGTQIAAIPGQIAAAQLTRAQTAASIATANNTLAAAQASAQAAGPTAAATAQTGLLNAQAALAAAQANAQVAGPIGVAAAQTAQINAQNALNAAQAGEPVLGQTNALSVQTSLLNAQAAQINAQVALVPTIPGS